MRLLKSFQIGIFIAICLLCVNGFASTSCSETDNTAQDGSFSTGYTSTFETWPGGTSVKITFELLDTKQEEYESYTSRMSETWLKDLQPLGTDWQKPFLETAPYLIMVFKRAYEIDEKGNKLNNYYVNESVGLACGFLLAAIQQDNLENLQPRRYSTAVSR